MASFFRYRSGNAYVQCYGRYEATDSKYRKRSISELKEAVKIIDKSNYLFAQVKTALGTNIKDASQTYQDTPASFPYMFFNQIGNESTADDLDNSENAVNTTVEITFYATGATKLNTCKNLMAIADTKMRSMGFRRTFGPQQITNIADTTICRYVARYNRIIGAGDTL